MELSLIKELGSLGVGAIFGLVVFFIYRMDRRATERMWRESKKFTDALIEKDQETREKHTQALTELTTLIERINGKPR